MEPSFGQASVRRRWLPIFGALMLAAAAVAWWRAADSARQAAQGPPLDAAAWADSTSAPGATTSSVAPAATRAAAPATQWTHPRLADRQRDRDNMVKVIRDDYGLTDRAVLAAMAAVPRHEFVPKNLSASAHDDSPLPIGSGQTISQPFIVAEMTRQLNLTARARVLEIGTGSGYQAAVLTEFTPHVFTIEVIGELAKSAAGRLKRLGYDTVQVKTADGYYGWEEEGPFDAIIVTCAAGQIPPPLVKQLAPGGRMIIPVGTGFATQSLMLVEKQKDGGIRSRSLMPVRFVPLVHTDK